ncbi:MAG: MFS transporter [Alphaproteobacteria bacterium]
MSSEAASAKSTAAPSAAAAAGLAPAVVPLMAIAMFINYVDRGNLATAGPLVKSELHLSGTAFGLLISAFFWSYVPAQIFTAWLAERYNAYRVLAFSLGLWSISTIATGFAAGFTFLLVLRLLLGLGEGGMFPASSKLIGQHLPGEKMGAANGLIGVGLALGPAFGTFVGGLLMAKFGWRPVFLIFGVASLLWLIPWQLATRHASAQAKAPTPGETPSFLAILARREAWGACLGHFCNNFAFYFFISWLPLYLTQARGFSVAQMAQIGGAVYLVYAASCYLVGKVSDAWMARGASATRVRKTALVINCTLVFTSLLCAGLGNIQLCIAALLVSGFAFGFATTTIYCVGQTIAGPRVAGKWVGVQNCAGNFAGIVAPIITGFVVDSTGQFVWAFVIAGVVALTGLLGWVVLIRKVEPLDWSGVKA